MEKYTKESIQKLLNEYYGDKYEVIDYTWSKSPVILKCKNHGEFSIRVDHIKAHLGKELCKKCKKEKARLEKFKKFVVEAKKIHNDKYIYHEEHFTNFSAKTLITCPIHGDFWQTPLNHIHNKQGCRKCYEETRKGSYKYTKEEIIKKCKEVHGDRYTYDNVIFQGMKNKLLNIYCPKHGYFDQIAYDHLRGFGCEKCKFENQTLTKDEFIKKATKIHNGLYTYDKEKIVYINGHTKIPIICPTHGEFWQIPANHLLGIGCPYCQTSKLEKEIFNLLKTNKIGFIQKYHSDWLGRLELDFFIPKYKVGIECQGKQHFEKINHFDNTDSFENRLERDERKRRLCEENGVKLLYYSNLGIKYPYEVFENKDSLLNEIRDTP